MFRKLCCAALVAVLLSAGAALPAQAYTPRPGVRFNHPDGPRPAMFRSLDHVRKSIRSAPRGSVIRLASYSYNRRDITDALLAACGRGVTVQVVLNDNWTSRATRRLRGSLGTDIDPHWDDACHPRTPPDPDDPDAQPYPHASFVKVCRRSCRGGGGNQHIKLFLFSRAGTADDVVMLGSTNLSGYAATVHWNDLLTLTGKARMFGDYSALFRELAEDRRVAEPFRTYTHGSLITEVGPNPAAARRAHDPVLQRLDRVRCRAAGGTGVRGRTAVRIMMYAWVGRRGRYLAENVAGLSRRGCNVRVILSQPSKGVRQALRRGGVGMRTADLDQDGDPTTGFGDTPWEQFTHEKWMALNGVWSGTPQRVVWTGSENWSDKSLVNDELTLRIPRRSVHRAYLRHFDLVWTRHSRPL